jgi:hypothetical protein
MATLQVQKQPLLFKVRLLNINIFNVLKTSQQSILRGVGSLRYNDTIQVK